MAHEFARAKTQDKDNNVEFIFYPLPAGAGMNLLASNSRQIHKGVVGDFPVVAFRVAKITGVTAPEHFFCWFD